MAIDTALAKENAAAGYVGAATLASLHTADPAGTGAAEVAGGAPAYAKQAVTWTAGAVDGVYVSNMLTFNVPPNTTITHAGLWTTGGVYLDKAVVDATFVSQGVFQLTLTYTQA